MRLLSALIIAASQLVTLDAHASLGAAEAALSALTAEKSQGGGNVRVAPGLIAEDAEARLRAEAEAEVDEALSEAHAAGMQR